MAAARRGASSPRSSCSRRPGCGAPGPSGPPGIKILQAAGVSVVATKGPSLDMTTAYGRAMAGLLGEFDTMEVEVKSERQQLAYQAQRDAGIRHPGPPAFMDSTRRPGRDESGRLTRCSAGPPYPP